MVVFIYDPDGNLIYQDTFNASNIEDNSYYRIKLDQRLQVHKGEEYTFTICANTVSPLTKLAFYASSTDGAICSRVYGGDTDFWWHGLFVFFFIYALIILIRLYLNEKNGVGIRKDQYLQGLLLGVLIFFLLCAFARKYVFCDEFDNIRGGLAIANGKVLYRDYITQHMPIMYYLNAVFAIFGASSTEQFRISYYIFESLIWVFLFIRHNKYYGKIKMIALPALECIFLLSVMSPYRCMVFAENIQGLLFVSLLLEFIRYIDDHKLSWDRCIVVSICIWGSIGTIFLSVYAILLLAIIFLFCEILHYRITRIKLGNAFHRYYKLLLTLIVPILVFILYFHYHRALRIAFEQFYTFNREVYPNYLDGYGESVFQPLIDSIYSYFGFFYDFFTSLLSATASFIDLLRIILLIISSVAIIGLLENKHIIEGISVGSMMIFLAYRNYGAHGLAAWYIVIMIIVLYVKQYRNVFKSFMKPVSALLFILLCCNYVVIAHDNLSYEQPTVSDLENKVIELTENDSDKSIMVDAFYYDSLYLLYKGRDTANPAVYMLPWYMDWYEQKNVDVLLEEQPHVVIYNIDRITWDYSYYNNTFDNVLLSNYTPLGNDGWESTVWIKNE